MLWRRSLIRLARTVIKSENKAVTWRNISFPHPLPTITLDVSSALSSSFFSLLQLSSFFFRFSFLLPSQLHPLMSVNLRSSCSTFFLLFSSAVLLGKLSDQTAATTLQLEIFAYSISIPIHFSSFSSWIFFQASFIIPRFFFVGNFTFQFFVFLFLHFGTTRAWILSRVLFSKTYVQGRKKVCLFRFRFFCSTSIAVCFLDEIILLASTFLLKSNQVS